MPLVIPLERSKSREEKTTSSVVFSYRESSVSILNKVNFAIATRKLNTILKKKNPERFSSSWIFKNVQPVYRYARLHCRTENGDIDWDRVTHALSRKFQKRWVRYKRKQVKSYENQIEVDRILNRYKDELYTLIAPNSEKDRHTRNRIVISFVRIAQKGNILARREIITWTTYIVDDWIDKYWQLRKWKGYKDEIEEKIAGCVRCYRYTGTFLGYLFRTLEYSARGIVPLSKYSLDDPVFDGKETKINYVIHDQTT